jgi:hypothetical protein
VIRQDPKTWDFIGEYFDECIGDLHFYENGPSVNRQTNLASIRTRLAPVAPGALCVPVRCGAAI